jgi:hypothetical protein
MKKKEKTTATPTLKASELRIGNLIEYYVFDELGKPQEEWVASYVDTDDLKWLNENEGDENYRPMRLTDDLLKRFGFNHSIVHGNNFWLLGKILIFEDKKGQFEWSAGLPIKSVHHLQNFYFALTGKELKP